MVFRSIQALGRLAVSLGLRLELGLALVLVLACGLGTGGAWAAGGPRQGVRVALEDPDNARVIVKYRGGSPLAVTAVGRPQHATRLGRQLTLAMQDGHVLGQRTQSLRASGLSSSQLAARLAALPEVEWAVPARRKTINAVEPDDPYFGGGQTTVTPAVGQWYLRAPNATALSAVNALGAWAITTGSAAVTVAVLDTGVVKTHPDLAGKLYAGYDFVSRSGQSADGDGRDADASDPGDWSTSSDSCGAKDSSWHGTQVAGLIGAATDNAIGMAGIGRNVMVLPVRVLGKCGGYDDDIIAAMRWAAGRSNNADCAISQVPGPNCNPNQARVLNLSLGSSGTCSSAYREAIAETNAAGVVVVVAAGNDIGHAVNEPANCPGVIAVAGVRHAGTKVGYSNIGPEVAIAAPAGNCVNDSGACLYPLLTTTNAGKTSPGAHTYSDSFNRSLGTSFAAPMVAGTAALMLSVDGSLTPVQVKAALQSTARAFPLTGAQTTGAAACLAPTALDQIECYCTTSTCGTGMLDAGAAVEKVAGAVAQPLAVFAVSTANPTVGASVMLDGGPSSVAGDSVLWSIESGAGNALFTGGTSSRRTSLTFTASGAVVVRLRVAMATGASSTADKTLTAVLAPTASFVVSNPYTTVGAPVSLDGVASLVSPGRTVDSYQWTINGTTAAHFTTATNGSAATLQADEVGDNLSVTLTVTDSAGATGSATQSIAVAAAPKASFSLSTPSPAAGTTVTLDGSESAAAAGHSLRSHAWAVVSGAGLAAFSGAVDTSSATLITQAAGAVVVRLTVVDDAGAVASSEQTITVVTPPATSSGGGALAWGWLAGLALAVLALSRRR